MGRPILNQLPVEIIDEILLKLPIKSLLRFKCVSKSWCSSISSGGFITEHLNKSKTRTDFAHHNLIFTVPDLSDFRTPLTLLRSFSIGSFLNDEPNPCIPSNLPIYTPASEYNGAIYLSGSCNGIILIIINYQEFHLWNPASRKSKNILLPQGICSWENCEHRRYGYGFGYDESTDDYKVVCIFSCEIPNEPQMYMYSSRTDSWKKIRDFDLRFLVYSSAKFVNGRLHWVTRKREDPTRKSWHIVSLDLVEEKYQIVDPPQSFLDYYDPCWPVLQDLGGYLSLTYHDDVWVMMKYGEKESWSKIWTFPPIGRFAPWPLWLKKNRDIAMAFGSEVIICRGKYRLRQSSVNMIHDMFESTIYVESLVWPFGDDEQVRQ